MTKQLDSTFLKLVTRLFQVSQKSSASCFSYSDKVLSLKSHWLHNSCKLIESKNHCQLPRRGQGICLLFLLWSLVLSLGENSYHLKHLINQWKSPHREAMQTDTSQSPRHSSFSHPDTTQVGKKASRQLQPQLASHCNCMRSTNHPAKHVHPQNYEKQLTVVLSL